MLSYYSPIKATDERNITSIYIELSSLFCRILKHNVLIIGGSRMLKYAKAEIVHSNSTTHQKVIVNIL